MPKLNSFSLYLAGSKRFRRSLTENAREMMKRGPAKKSTSSKFADGAALYVFPGQRSDPKWVGLLKPSFTLPEILFAQSPCALLLFKKGKFIFAITFASARLHQGTSHYCAVASRARRASNALTWAYEALSKGCGATATPRLSRSPRT